MRIQIIDICPKARPLIIVYIVMCHIKIVCSRKFGTSCLPAIIEARVVIEGYFIVLDYRVIPPESETFLTVIMYVALLNQCLICKLYTRAMIPSNLRVQD